MKKILLIPSMVAVTAMPLIGLVGCGEAPIEKFSTDSGETVCEYAEGGIDKLCEVYACKEDDFVGRTRKITVNEQEYTVRVVGVNQDYEDNIELHVGPLTFQFTNLISDNSGMGKKFQWIEDNPNHHYNDSILYHSLNDITGSEEFPSVYEMIINSNDWAKTGIKEVGRSACINNDDEKGGVIEKYENMIFCPTLANIFSSDVVGDIKAIYKEEGEQYKYYQKKIGDGPTTNKYTCLTFCDLKGTKHANGLSTPSIDSIEDLYAGHIDEDGQVQDAGMSGSVSIYNAIAPCFCI